MSSMFRPSRIKAFLTIFFPSAILFSLLWWAITLQEKHLYSTKVSMSEQKIIELAVQLFETAMADRLSDAVILVDLLQGEISESSDLSHISNMILSYMQNKKTCDQIRYMDISGMEQIRINWDENKGGVIKPESELQFKGDRYYFKSGMSTTSLLYVSRLDLNIEQNEIERPFKPMIRITHRVLNRAGQQPKGLFVMNVLGAGFIKQLAQAETNSSGKIYLVNDRGDWLKGPTPEVEWQFMFQKEPSDTLASRYPDEWRRIASNARGQFRSRAGLFTYHTVDLRAGKRRFGYEIPNLEADESWKIVGFVPERQLRPSWLDMAVTALGLGIAALVILAVYLTLLRIRRTEAIRRLTENEKKLNVITSSVQDAIVMIDSFGRATFWNQAAERIFGFSADEIMGHNIHDFVTPQGLRPSAAEGLKGFSTSGGGRFIGVLREIEAMRKDGSHFPAELHISAIHMEGQWWGVGVLRDITGRKKTEEELRESERRFRRAMLDAPYPVMMYTEDGQILLLNKTWTTLTGYSIEEIPTTAHWAEKSHRSRRDIAAAQFDNLHPSDQRIEEGEFEITTKTGETVIWDFGTAALGLQPDGIRLAISMARDITAQKQIEERLRHSEKRLREAQSIAHVGNWEWMIQEDTLFWSDEVYRIFGLSPQEFQADFEQFVSYVHPEDRPAVDLAVQSALTHGTNYDVEHRICLKDGSERTVRERGQVSRDDDGTPVRMAGTVQDVTELKRAEVALKRSHEILEKRVVERTKELNEANEILSNKIIDLEKTEFELKKLSLAIEQNPCTVLITDLEGTIEYANPSFTRTTGYPVQEALGKNPRIISSGMHPPEFYKDLWDTISSGHVWRGEICNRKSNGELFWELASISPVRNSRGDFTHYVAVKDDITDRKLKEQELQKAKEQADIANQAKSNFLARMSHEIRTPMNGVLGLVEVLAHSELSLHQADLVTTIRTSASHLLHLIDDVLDFSKIEADQIELDYGEVRVADLVENVGHTLAGLAMQQQVALRLFVSPRLPARIRGDENRLRQIVYNLVGNAIKFSAGRPRQSGKVEVRAEMQEADSPILRITVSDNGIGISPGMAGKLFEPFTQGDSTITRRFGGTGLGLSICKRLVELMGGRIAVTGTPGGGSTFTVKLPLEIVPGEPEETPQTNLAGIRCILLSGRSYVADDLQEYLEHAGAEVLRPADAEIEASISEGGKESVLICDLSDPHAPPPDSDMRRVLISSGRRWNPRLTGPGTVSVDIDVLRYASLVRAVAMAVGRVIEEVEPPRVVRRTAAVDVEKERAAGRLILVAEDDMVNQKVILQQLDLLGYAAEVAADGAEALHMWREGRYALLLADLHMPVMDGYELTRIIRDEEARAAAEGQDLPRLPILALTADATHSGKEDAGTVGMDAFLTKPILLDKLRVALEPWLPPSGAVAAATQPAQKEEVADRRTQSLVDVSILKGLIGEDPETLQEFFLDFLDNSDNLAKQIDEAAAQDDIPYVGALAHKLKSSSRSVGALTLGDLCADLENAARRNDRAQVTVRLLEYKRMYTEVAAEIMQLLKERNDERE